MNRHLPHLLALIKGLILIIGLLAFALSGGAEELARLLEARFYHWSFLVVPAYWLLIIMASLVVVFPFTLAEDHALRQQEGEHEEAPWSHWLRGFAAELGLGVALGSVVFVAMAYAPGAWWWVLALAWTGYHVLQPKVQGMALMAEDEDAPPESRTDLLQELKEPLARAGIALTDVRLIPEDNDLPLLHFDMQLVASGNDRVLFIPESWAHRWTLPEVIAVALHKVWMEGASLRRRQTIAHVLTGASILGGYALVAPHAHAAGLMESPHHPASIPAFILWMIVTLFITRIPLLAWSRRWMRQADDAVCAWMNTPDGLRAALQRANEDDPGGMAPPRWAEILFFNAPSLQQRIARLTPPA
ncbi:MAG TPA: hypothetical protein PKE26_15155 [Kiritimatiellia bacterium]|nr:hypothetical protein [Kiritimatiellia bacterium]